ncbi:MAG TPA: SIS domain-containing protein [Gemmatimonas aurantiaca]|uniref:Phosphoheptose isomerase n=2 Tax=Gemmatimonas aurantiaca TaxID=173480 RepID=C1ACX0_GEMAT|nr:SIS domain-containing protein [Gemmatimonas aurantiaca]BAH40347.1 phosphoheptose isomerase [Gemmatimonas aurantiaca T-27]HCT57643.1 SIS domain-containing protein [Gemmatimonas aurantiaca]
MTDIRRDIVTGALAESADALNALRNNAATLDAIMAAGALLAETLSGRGRVYSCGNGGSMSDAMHFAEELSGRYRQNRRALAAQAISDVGHLSCVANDFGYEQVFARYVEAHGQAGDVLVAISTSGTSPNVLRAAEVARARGMHVVAFTGRRDTPLGALADIELCTPAGRYADRVQELHIKVIHILLELVEQALFPELSTPPAHST